MAVPSVPLSLRHVEDLIAERGINVSFQTVSEWASKFGRKFAHHLQRRSRGSFADKWHFDEMVVAIKGNKHWLWRLVAFDKIGRKDHQIGAEA